MNPRARGRGPTRYDRIIERIFAANFRPGMTEVPFRRDEIEQAAADLDIPLPKNLGDVIYSFRYRSSLPRSVRIAAPKGTTWLIKPAGRSRYRFVAVKALRVRPAKGLAETKIPDATPGIISLYALNDEQALLAKIRYNRLIDVFAGLACYSLQSHLRTTVPAIGQVELDEIYIGVDKRGAHYVFPVEAKGPRETIGTVQIEQSYAMCASKFPGLVCRPIGAQSMESALIALFEFDAAQGEIVIVSERHYRLVPPEDVSPEELQAYQTRPLD